MNVPFSQRSFSCDIPLVCSDFTLESSNRFQLGETCFALLTVLHALHGRLFVMWLNSGHGWVQSLWNPWCLGFIGPNIWRYSSIPTTHRKKLPHPDPASFSTNTTLTIVYLPSSHSLCIWSMVTCLKWILHNMLNNIWAKMRCYWVEWAAFRTGHWLSRTGIGQKIMLFLKIYHCSRFCIDICICVYTHLVQ